MTNRPRITPEMLTPAEHRPTPARPTSPAPPREARRAVPPSRSETREQLIDEALAVLQPLSPEPLSREDGREFVDDLTVNGHCLAPP